MTSASSAVHSERHPRGFALTCAIAADPDRVFAAWTQPKHLTWFFNPAMPTPTEPTTVDLRVGGEWRQQMVVTDDLAYPTGGVYVAIVPGERLAFRWGARGGWPDLDGRGAETPPLVTVALRPVGASTEVTLSVAFADELSDDEVRHLIDGGTLDGWSETLGRLHLSSALDSPL